MTRRGVSFDRGHPSSTGPPGAALAFSPGDAPRGEKPSKRRLAPDSVGGAETLENGSPERALEKTTHAAEEKATDYLPVRAAATDGRSASPSSPSRHTTCLALVIPHTRLSMDSAWMKRCVGFTA